MCGAGYGRHGSGGPLSARPIGRAAGGNEPPIRSGRRPVVRRQLPAGTCRRGDRPGGGGVACGRTLGRPCVGTLGRPGVLPSCGTAGAARPAWCRLDMVPPIGGAVHGGTVLPGECGPAGMVSAIAGAVSGRRGVAGRMRAGRYGAAYWRHGFGPARCGAGLRSSTVSGDCVRRRLGFLGTVSGGVRYLVSRNGVWSDGVWRVGAGAEVCRGGSVISGNSSRAA